MGIRQQPDGGRPLGGDQTIDRPERTAPCATAT